MNESIVNIFEGTLAAFNNRDSKYIRHVNPKPEDQKHYPNTSETSHPHSSDDHPYEHVDTMHFNESGKPDDTHDVDGIDDPGMVQMGKEQKEMHESQKEAKDKE